MPDPRIDVTIGANTAPFAGAVDQVMGRLRTLLTIGALVHLGKQSIDLAGRINDLATKAGVATDWLQAMGFAASQTGSSVEALADAMTFLRRAQADALGGGKEPGEAFRDLGINLDELRSLSPEQLFERIAQSVKSTGGGLRETAAALEVLGRGGKELLPAMVEGFDALAESARQLGLVLGQDTLDRLDATGDRFDAIALKAKIVAAYIVNFVYHIKDLVRWLSPLGFVMRLIENVKSERGFAAGLKKTFQDSLSPIENMTNEMALEMLAIDAIAQSRRNALAKAGASGGGIAFGEKSPARTTDATPHDSLQRIGGFIGSAGSVAVIGLQRQQLQELRRIRVEIARNTQETKIDL